MRTHMRATVNYDRIYVCHTPPRVFVVGRKNKNDDDVVGNVDIANRANAIKILLLLLLPGVREQGLALGGNVYELQSLPMWRTSQ